MKKIILSLSTIAVVATIAVGGTIAYFSDTETSTGNTFTAGTLDLKVDGNDDPNLVPYTISDLVPGQYHQAGTVTLRNDGSIPGRVSVKLQNPWSDENSLEEPEVASGDLSGQEMEFGSYDANGGDGELWDSMWLQFYIDGNGDGLYSGGYAPYHDCIIHDGALDKSSYYSFPINIDLMPMNTDYYCTYSNVDLNPGDTVDVGIRAYYYSDTGGGPAGGWSTSMPPNNITMSDNIKFDVQYGLNQITP
jgi:predicted ribosomally synthesized peptide with SipW-like signal peptide